MTRGYLLDTNICVHFLNAQRKGASRRSRAEAAVWERFVGEPSPLHVSEASVGELLFGAHRSQRREENLVRLDAFLEMVPALAVTLEAWSLFGRTKAQLSAKGLTVPDLDLVIACSARSHDLVLVSNDSAFATLPAEFAREGWV